MAPSLLSISQSLLYPGIAPQPRSGNLDRPQFPTWVLRFLALLLEREPCQKSAMRRCACLNVHKDEKRRV